MRVLEYMSSSSWWAPRLKEHRGEQPSSSYGGPIDLERGMILNVPVVHFRFRFRFVVKADDGTGTVSI